MYSLYFIEFRRLNEKQEQELIRHYVKVASMTKKARQGLSDEQAEWLLGKIKRLINRFDNSFSYLSSSCELPRVISSRSLNKSRMTIAEYVKGVRLSRTTELRLLPRNENDRTISFAEVNELRFSWDFPFIALKKVIKEEFFPEEIRSAFAN